MKWTNEMDERLRHFVNEFGEDWSKIAGYMGIPPKKIREHWKMTGKVSRLPFSVEEDKQVMVLGPIYIGRWSLLASTMGGQRSALQIRNRYAQLVFGLTDCVREEAPPMEAPMSDDEFQPRFS
jgi:hypothetical protein